MSEPTQEMRAGFVAIIGAPNAGKSTLLNQVLGQKISITSKKPQTTRDRILGIVNRQGSQMVFVDTPGIHKSSTLLNQRIVDQALQAVEDVDLVVFMVDAVSRNHAAENLIISRLNQVKKPVILALNKIDVAAKQTIFKLVETFSPLYDFAAVVPVSARQNMQVSQLMDEVEKH
ncbi:MAG: GTPase Era, partial [Desulfotignum sp.]